MADEYEQDEFDQIAAAGGPVGVHRAPKPWWSIVVTPLVVFVVAGAVAYLVAQILWSSEVNSSADASATPTPSITSSVEASASAEPSPSASASAEPEVTETASETPEPEPEPDLALPVSVLNGTTTQGYAGAQAQILLDGGYTSVTPANLSGERPDVNRVVYAAEDQRVTAEDVASRLGIETVEQGTPTADADIEVQLVASS